MNCLDLDMASFWGRLFVTIAEGWIKVTPKRDGIIC